MSEVAIRAEGLSKMYRIGEVHREDALRNVIGDAVRAPWKLLKRERKKEFWALRDASFEIKRGDIVGLIGRNGAGKTTLLKILSRITKPSRGVADIYGRIGTLLEVGTGFHPELSGTDNIYMCGAILGMGRNEIRQKFDEIVDFAEIEGFLETPVKRYSSGMYVRLAFAVAAHLEPEILFVDEVLAVGDVQFQRKCLGKMKDVGSGGRTVVFVSHNVNAVAALCRSAMVLANGRIVHHSDDVQKALHAYAGNRTPSHIGDLTGHRGRVPHGPPIYRNIEIHSDENGWSHIVPPGASMLIRLRVMTAERLIGPKLSIGVTSIRGERIFAIGTHIGGNAIPHVEGAALVDVRFKLPYLVPGEYTLDIGFYDRTGLTMDEIYGAAVIEVLKDKHLTMTDPHGAHTGQVMVRSEWEAVGEELSEAGLAAPADSRDHFG